jgi:hypothetical protein
VLFSDTTRGRRLEVKEIGLLAQGRLRSFGDDDDAEHVRLGLPAEVVDGHLLDGRTGGTADVVDSDVERSELVDCVLPPATAASLTSSPAVRTRVPAFRGCS